MQHFDQTPWNKAENLHFNHILIDFKIHYGAVHRQYYKYYVNVKKSL